MTERFTEKVNGRNMVRNGIYGTIGTHGRYFVGEAIDKLAEYETAEEEGRLVVLPRCNIEDTVYIPVDFQNRIYTGNVKGYEYYTLIKKWVVKIRTNDRQTCYEMFENFGKTFFLTREEAEKALKEMKIENGSD